MSKKENAPESTGKVIVKNTFPFNKENYYLIILGIVLVITGFILMMGGVSENPNDFNESELFSFRRITLAPFTVILGYVVVLYAILRKPKA